MHGCILISHAVLVHLFNSVSLKQCCETMAVKCKGEEYNNEKQLSNKANLKSSY